MFHVNVYIQVPPRLWNIVRIRMVQRLISVLLLNPTLTVYTDRVVPGRSYVVSASYLKPNVVFKQVEQAEKEEEEERATSASLRGIRALFRRA